ncbi:hypothetical protein BB561_006359 [Smittium simulii]|uniref:Uncharacterized protein n=1 Tax=Smittium simulii TaxID=133385 RepID=A0A2T9Y4Y5_9FUNG|nr:hypothetical protein BB561_006359 [Smittium simulii]
MQRYHVKVLTTKIAKKNKSVESLGSAYTESINYNTTEKIYHTDNNDKFFDIERESDTILDSELTHNINTTPPPNPNNIDHILPTDFKVDLIPSEPTLKLKEDYIDTNTE